MLHDNKAFTLIEIIVTVVIIGVLTVLAVTSYTSHLERMKAVEGIRILKALQSFQLGYKFEYGDFTADINKIDVRIPNSKYFNNPTINAADPIAKIERKGGSYKLFIFENGTITCTSALPADCKRVGY